MDPIPWFYIYSPKYELFHHVLHSSLSDCSGFTVHSCFVPQSVFSGVYKAGEAHSLAGNYVKYTILLQILQAHPGQHLLMTDVDLVVDRLDEFRASLESYKVFDLTYMRESPTTSDINGGFAFIKSTDRTIAFYEQIIERLKANPDLNDQGCINDALPSFPGSYSLFDGKTVRNSNYHKLGEPFYVVQCLCSSDSFEKNLLEKLLTLATFFDLEPLRPLIPNDVWETVLWYHREKRPSHPLAHIKFVPLPSVE